MITKVFSADMETVSEMMEFVSGLAESLPPKVSYDMTLVCEEILVNISSYAYPDGDGDLTIFWDNDTDRRLLTVTFEDRGIQFNPLSRKEPDLNVPIADRQIGGLGIMMVRKLMDTVRYSFTDDTNSLTVTKTY